MSVCDSCRRPGHCCTWIYIQGREYDGKVWEGDDWKEISMRGLNEAMGQDHPFEPLEYRQIPAEMRECFTPYGYVYWSCKNLTPEGRCGDYENRPQLCRNYEPKQDALCIEHVPAFKNIPIVVK